MKVLLIGHACSPRLGSEPGFTWNWAWHLSRHHQVSVLAHPHDRRFVEKFLEEHPNSNLRFHWLDVPRFLDAWRSRAPGHDRGLRLHYLVWLKLAYRKAAELNDQISFHIAHHVSYGSLSAPPPARKLHIPFIWGPVGGAQRAPTSFKHYFGRSWKSEIIRNARLRFLPLSPSLRSAARASAITLATNQETANLLEQVGARDVRLYLDSGISSAFLSSQRAPHSHGETLTLLWAGRMQPRKALPLALEALAETPDIPVRLVVAGDGEMRGAWENCARQLHVENNVQFLGNIPWRQMPPLFQSADSFLFTSLRDSFGTQVLEAMAHGLPILTLNHQGVGTFVPPDAGIKIPVTTPRETVSKIADGIRWLAQNPEARRRMGEAGRAYAETQTWERRADWMSNLYEEVLSDQVSPALGGPASYGSHGVDKRMDKIDATLDLKGKRVLDLGCGNGCYSAELARRAAFVCAADFQMPYLKEFHQPIPRVQTVGENLPFASQTFDAVTMIEVLEHTRCDQQVLQECFRILRPGGLLVLFVPNKLYPFESHPCHIGNFSIGRNIPFVSWLPRFLRKPFCYAQIYTRRKLFSLARRAGFRNRESGYIFPPMDSFGLPFKRYYRQAARWLEKSPLARFGVSIYAVFEKPEVLSPETQLSPRAFSPGTASFETLGVRVHAAQIPDVVDSMKEWIQARSRCRSIAATGMHGIVEAQRDLRFKEILNTTDLVVPDGMPLVWLGRRAGHILPRRVYGPDLLLNFCEKTEGQGYRHFFYGGEPGIPDRLAQSLKKRFPAMKVVGTFSPPFRPLNPEEDADVVAMISRAAPDVVWVGLGTPKQERWIHEHRNQLDVPVLVGVGAAFDMLSGKRTQAPRWMGEHGLEWLFRLLQEPRRLWRRYLIYGPQFVTWVILEILGLRKLEPDRNTTKPCSALTPRKSGQEPLDSNSGVPATH